ncbi:MAG: B12-binding domain-containing radical SAM protein [Candidatus Loosdrechtia sp.]|uniref:B12-binding domain-containing radical SAM protein n=1 Tax=Candidatus Loosdrechtia sp. TaxID=3101272 RepID=UPI003A736C58|nr:MAG: B12-binding domain-containing radical SAM protein [Candidatus Jettenia sp. AMX2]
MEKFRNIDLLLWNSFMGKAYSLSDCFKENGIGILARACKDAGQHIIVEDPAKIDFYVSFTKNDLMPRLSELSRCIFTKNSAKEDSISMRKEWNLLQENLRKVISERMENYIGALARKIRDNHIKVLGIKTWLGDRFAYSERLTHKVNELSPDTLVIAGGPQVNQFKTHALEKSPFDFCIDSEGEVTLTRIVSAVNEMYSQGRSKFEVIRKITSLAEEGTIFNLIYRNSAGKVKETGIRRLPLSSKPFPFYEKEDGKVNIAVISESSGCYYGKCNFCTHPNITGRYQPRDVGVTIEEIKKTMKESGTGLFRFAGSTTPVFLGRKIARAIVEEGLIIEYSMFVRVEANACERMAELIDSYEKIIDSGLRAVFLGVEAANNEILTKIMNKGISVEDAYYTIKAIKQASYNRKKHLDVGVSFIYPCPLPHDSIMHGQVLEENLHLLRTLKDENYSPDSVLITPGAPLPATNWQLEPGRFGFELPEDYLQTILRYEYELTKDPSTWPELNISLQGIKFLDMLKMSGLMEKKVREIGYTVNVSDEHCLAARSAGFTGQAGLEEFKIKGNMALMTTNYHFLKDVYHRINQYSSRLAEKNSFL